MTQYFSANFQHERSDSTRVSHSARRHGDDLKLLHVLAHSYLSITFYLLSRHHCYVSIRPYLLLRSYCCALLRIPGRPREYLRESIPRFIQLPLEELFFAADTNVEDFLRIPSSASRCRWTSSTLTMERYINNAMHRVE